LVWSFHSNPLEVPLRSHPKLIAGIGLREACRTPVHPCPDSLATSGSGSIEIGELKRVVFLVGF